MKTAQIDAPVWRQYVHVTKPGIIRANVLTVTAGFFFASSGVFDWLVGVGVIAGSALLIAGACVLNNILDRNIDARMSRTKNRALVIGAIPVRAALWYGIALLAFGTVLLWLNTNPLTLVLGIVAVWWYVVVYGYAKRTTYHSTLIGTVPGALPLVAGYTSVIGEINLTAGLLFLCMVVWQMPHFYAIAIYRKVDYMKAKLPVLSVAKSIRRTKTEIRLYTILYIAVIGLFYIYTNVGLIFLIGMSIVSAYWVYYAFIQPKSLKDEKWAKGVFGISLLVLLLFCILISIAYVLP